ncbi:redoxin domain-containing protein [Haloarcula salina]|uniref:Redoxin domain-containing protein n=1 Tax=Haloarcula salina TaxID=1429914 RepID=A0AA41KGZ4_9EURY|nr:redoxin domain-containing protein [Haloarcula salina]MBV0901196.1 redoxin domain-containing protein [Haloarcula salina]
MLSVGDTAPDFTAPVANGDIDELTLSEDLDDAPIVLAFFPGAFTSVCSHEMNTFQDRLGELDEAGATLYGVSIDTPFSQNAFRDELGLSFALLSDNEREIIDDYGISMDFEELGVPNVAKRAVFVVDGNQEITYAWVSDDPGVEPDYDEVIDALN